MANVEPQRRPTPEAGGANPLRIDPATGLPLPDPYPEYVRCPHCGEAEVEMWCYEPGVLCHNCGEWIEHARPPGCGTYPTCKRAEPPRPPSPQKE